MLLLAAGTVQASTLSYNFNSTSIPAGKKIWFSAVVRVNGTATYPLVINFTNQTITSSAFNLSVPDGQLIIDASVATATTVFTGGKWVTTAPPSTSGNYFISGYCDSLTNSIVGGLHPVSWNGTFTTCKTGISINWQWAAAVYNSFHSNMNNLGVKPSDCSHCSAYSNSDKAGTPENYKSSVTTVAGGGSSTSGSGGCGGGSGASNVGTYSAIGTVTPAAGSYAGALCAGSTLSETATIAGGSWSSGVPAVATINSSGVVSALAAGTTRRTYTVNGCRSWGTVTVNAVPVVSATTTTSLLCGGNTLNLQSTSSTSGSGGSGGGCGGGSGSSVSYIWRGPAGFYSAAQNCSRSGITTAMSGVYTVIVTSNGCSANATTTAVTVNQMPSSMAVSVSPNPVCAGNTTHLNATVSGGSGYSLLWRGGVSTISNNTTTNATITSVTMADAGVYTLSASAPGCTGSNRTTVALAVNAIPTSTGATNSGATCTGLVTLSAHSSSATRWSWVGSNGFTSSLQNPSTTISGTTTFSVTLSNATTGCSSDEVYTTVATLAGTADAGSISGAAAMCTGTTTTFSGSVTGGIWSSNAAAVASVNAAGEVTGVSAGMATISYVVTNGCGTAITTRDITVNGVPDAGSINGGSAACAGTSLLLSNTVNGGEWTTDAPAIATIDAAGNVSANGAGIAHIAYTVANSCGSSSSSTAINVNAAPTPGNIEGLTAICPGTSANLTNAVTGGAWTTEPVATATIDAAGVITGLAAGTAIVSYTAGNECGSTTATAVATVNALPEAGTITAAANLCAGTSTALNNTVSEGEWSTDAAAIATVDASGNVAGIGAGIANIVYRVSNSCGIASASSVVTVTGLPDAGTISGAASLCAGATTTMYNTAPGGVWSTSGTGAAAVDATGVLTGNNGGSETISYAVSNNCGSATATRVIIVTSMPDAGTISGSSDICTGTSTMMNNTANGGVWASEASPIATINATGVITGVAAGAATIRYTVSNSCGSASTTTMISVNTLPVAGTITGAAPVCAGNSVTLANLLSGGSWTSANPGIATVNSLGVVTGVADGDATISYTVANSCGTASATALIPVTGLPNAGAMAGPSHVGVDSIIVLTNPTGDAGGTWTANNSCVMIAGGLINGLVPGTVTVSYTVSNSCGIARTTRVITIDSPVFRISDIAGTSFLSCVGGQAAFWNNTTGGIFTMSDADAAVATVSPIGVVTGVSAGTATLSYTAWGATTTSIVTVYPVPAAIAGPANVCNGSTSMLTNVTPGGVWTSGIPSTASISPDGIITGNNAGTVTMYYTLVAPAGCRSSIVVTVNPNPMGIVGPESVCTGATIALTDATPGGTWSGSNSHASVDAAGNITGISTGGVSVSYTGLNGCFRYYVVNITQGPTAINGNLNACIGTYTYLSDAVTPGVGWSSSNPAVATITASGAVTPITAGTTRITYTLSPGCLTTSVVTVNTIPVVSAILGASSVSRTGPGVTLSDLTPGGIWTSSNTAILTVGSATGVVTANVSAGSAYINYIVTNAAGCAGFAYRILSASPAPRSHGGTTTSPGSLINLNSEMSAGEWISSDNSVATVDENGIVNAIAEGSTEIAHTVTNSAGEIATSVTTVTVKAQPLQVSMAPNPNNGRFVLKGTTGSVTDAVVNIDVLNMAGQVVYTTQIVANRGVMNEAVQTDSSLPNGTYIMNVRNGNETQIVHFVIGK